MEYVLGFAFDKKTGRVLLLRKARPAHLAGKLNGVGGKVEEGEKPYSAMCREFREETGLVAKMIGIGWKRFGALKVPDGKIHLYAKMFPINVDLKTCAGQPDEPVGLYDPYDLPDEVLNNLRWLVPMALCVADGTGGTKQITVNAHYER